MDATYVSWQASMTHGHSPGVQLRAALCLLALGRLRPTHLRQASTEGTWLRLLSLEEQHAYYALIQYGEKADGRANGVALGDNAESHHVHLTDGAHLHGGIVHQDAWLGLIDASAPAHGLKLPAGGTKMWQLGSGDRRTLAQGPTAAGENGSIWRLPWPLHAEFLQAPEALGTGLLWLAGPEDPEESLAHLHAARHAYGPGVCVFDAYGRYNRRALRERLPDGVEVLGPSDARTRRGYFSRCKVFEASGQGSGPDPFAIEATALGLSPWAESRSPQKAVAAEAIVDVAQLLEALLPVLEGHSTEAEVPDYVVEAPGHKQVRVVRALGRAPAPTAPRAVLLWGPLPHAGEWAALAQSIAQWGCGTVLAQVGPHTAFLGPLMLAHLSVRRPGAPDYQHSQSPEQLHEAALQWLSQAPSGAALEVLVPSGDRALMHRSRELVAAWLQAGCRPKSVLPAIAINSSTDFRISGASATQVGAGVASSDICWGTYLAAAQRFEPKWLRHAGKDYDVASQFMHPLTRPMLAHAHSCDTQLWNSTTLRLALQHDAVDGIFMAGGPLGSSVQTMRSLYAQKPVPWVSVLHGMHSPNFQNEISAYMLNGPVYPFDGFISPSQCGRTVFLNLWESLRQWLLVQGQTRVPGPVDVTVIPYGVDTAYYAPRHRLACRQNLRLPPHAVTILTLGRISRRFKTCLLPLLLSMQQLLARGIVAELVIAGAVMAEAELVRLKAAAAGLGLTGCVHFRVDVSLEDKAQLLSAADIFVAMSDSCQETHGIAPIEAMAAGLPVVAAAWDGFREIVVHDETGFLVPTAWTDIPQELFVDNAVDKQARDLGFDDLHETLVTDVAALSRALETLCSNRALREQMGQRGMARARQHFDTQKQGVRIADYLMDRVREAQRYQPHFEVPEPYMLVDRVDQRFAHYATHRISPDFDVVAGPSAHDTAFRKVVTQYIGAQDDEEAEILDSIANAAIAAKGPIPLRSLLGPRVDMLRLMRCLKYDILRLAPLPR